MLCADTLSVMAPGEMWGMVAVICILAASQPYKYNWGVRKLTGETLKVVLAEFYTLSWAVYLL
jgi:hypothetical protein